jgi:hypothetical protein
LGNVRRSVISLSLHSFIIGRKVDRGTFFTRFIQTIGAERLRHHFSHAGAAADLFAGGDCYCFDGEDTVGTILTGGGRTKMALHDTRVSMLVGYYLPDLPVCGVLIAFRAARARLEAGEAAGGEAACAFLDGCFAARMARIIHPQSLEVELAPLLPNAEGLFTIAEHDKIHALQMFGLASTCAREGFDYPRGVGHAITPEVEMLSAHASTALCRLLECAAEFRRELQHEVRLHRWHGARYHLLCLAGIAVLKRPQLHLPEELSSTRDGPGSFVAEIDGDTEWNTSLGMEAHSSRKEEDSDDDNARGRGWQYYTPIRREFCEQHIRRSHTYRGEDVARRVIKTIGDVKNALAAELIPTGEPFWRQFYHFVFPRSDSDAANLGEVRAAQETEAKVGRCGNCDVGSSWLRVRCKIGEKRDARGGQKRVYCEDALRNMDLPS